MFSDQKVWIPYLQDEAQLQYIIIRTYW